VKKIAIVSFLAIYLFLNLGITMKVHYCGDSISYIDFLPVTKKTCCGGEKASCCKDKLTHIAPETIQETIQFVSFNFPDFAKFNLVEKNFSFLSVALSDKTEIVHPVSGDKIFYYKLPLYLRNRAIIV
jgi:hypothetical protein